MIKVGNNIKKLRELKNYTQEFMATSLNMSQNGYSKIERDETEMTFTKLENIAKILEMDWRAVLDFDDKHIFNVHNCTNGTLGNNFSVIHNDKMIEHLQQEILHLRSENTFLLNNLKKSND